MFQAASFTPTKWSTAEDKARFANWYVMFVEGGFKASDFFQRRYQQLSTCFGHIAHYDREGFYATWFTNKVRQRYFLLNTLEHPCYGDPEYTFSDVERELRDWVSNSGIPQRLTQEIAQETEAEEKQQLARLQAKYS